MSRDDVDAPAINPKTVADSLADALIGAMNDGLSVLDVNIEAHPSRLPSSGRDVSAEVRFIGRLILGETKIAVQAEDAVLGVQIAERFGAGQFANQNGYEFLKPRPRQIVLSSVGLEPLAIVICF